MQVHYPLNNPQGEKRTYGKQPPDNGSPGRMKTHAPGESCTSACELSAGQASSPVRSGSVAQGKGSNG